MYTIEVCPVKNIGDDAVTVTTREAAEYWSVYVRRADGLADWVADYPTEAEANAYADKARRELQAHQRELNS